MQVFRQFFRAGGVLLVVIETTAVYGPHFTVDAFLLALGIFRRSQTVIEHNEVDGLTHPCDSSDDV